MVGMSTLRIAVACLVRGIMKGTKRWRTGKVPIEDQRGDRRTRNLGRSSLK